MTRLSNRITGILTVLVLASALTLTGLSPAAAHTTAQEEYARRRVLSWMPRDVQVMVLTALSKMPHDAQHRSAQSTIMLLQTQAQVFYELVQTFVYVLANLPVQYRQIVVDGIMEVSPQSAEAARAILIAFYRGNAQNSAIAASLHRTNMRTGMTWACSLGGGTPVGPYCVYPP